MKHYLIKCFPLFYLLCGSLTALPTLNPYEPKFMSRSNIGFYQGFYGDYVFNRNLATTNDDAIRSTTLNTNAAYFSIRGWHRVELFATFGSSMLNITTPATSFGNFSRMLSINPQDGFSWSGGLNSYLFEYGGFAMGASASHFITNSYLDRVVDLDNGTTTYLAESKKVHYTESQLSVSLCRKYNLSPDVLLMPYASGKYSNAQLSFNDLHLTLTTKEDLVFSNLQALRNYGYTVGLSLIGYESANLTFEGRFYDEKALHLNFSFCF